MSQLEGPLLAHPHELRKTDENSAFNIFLKKELLPIPSNLVETDAELIGQVLLKSESKKTNSSDKLKEKPVKLLSRQELQMLSEKIDINGNNLWQIYSNKLIGENGLRRVLHEYFNGGKALEVLKNEIMEHDIDFERDPAIRDLSVQGSNLTINQDEDSTAALENLLKKAEASFSTTTDENKSYDYRAIESASLKQYRLPLKQNYSDRLFISIISGLIITIFLIYIFRH